MNDTAARRGLLVLLVSAALLFTANAGRLSLLPLDDCHYAQKGVEMAQRGAFFSVTWNGQLTSQNAPLQFWILSRSFAWVGFNDLAARLPSILMALAVMVITFETGRRTVGSAAALGGVALLLLTNTFLQNARRCMLEIPTCLWVSLFFLVYLRGLERPRWLLLLSIPLAAAVLTKSVIGLIPLGVVATTLRWRELRPSGGVRYLVSGVTLGLIGGASWTVHQGLVYGWEWMHAHYFGEVGRAVSSSRPLDYVLAYPRILLLSFQPVVIPGLIGAVWVWRRRPKTTAPRARLLSLWIGVWLLVASLSSARVARYVWPTLIPLSLLAGLVLETWSARVMHMLCRYVVPVALVVGAALYWVAPRTVSRDVDAPFKRAGASVRTVLPEGSRIPLLGEPSWSLNNPLLYYGHQAVGVTSTSVDTVVAAARELPQPLLLVESSRMSALERGGIEVSSRFDLGSWHLVELTDPSPDSTAGRP